MSSYNLPCMMFSLTFLLNFCTQAALAKFRSFVTREEENPEVTDENTDRDGEGSTQRNRDVVNVNSTELSRKYVSDQEDDEKIYNFGNTDFRPTSPSELFLVPLETCSDEDSSLDEDDLACDVILPPFLSATQLESSEAHSYVNLSGLFQPCVQYSATNAGFKALCARSRFSISIPPSNSSVPARPVSEKHVEKETLPKSDLPSESGSSEGSVESSDVTCVVLREKVNENFVAESTNLSEWTRRESDAVNESWDAFEYMEKWEKEQTNY